MHGWSPGLRDDSDSGPWRPYVFPPSRDMQGRFTGVWLNKRLIVHRTAMLRESFRCRSEPQPPGWLWGCRGVDAALLKILKSSCTENVSTLNLRPLGPAPQTWTTQRGHQLLPSPLPFSEQVCFFFFSTLCCALPHLKGRVPQL